MGNRDQRGNKEARKPKQAKAAPAPGPSPFIVTPGKNTPGGKKG